MPRIMALGIRKQATRNYHFVDILTSLRAPIGIGTNYKVVGDITWNSKGKWSQPNRRLYFTRKRENGMYFRSINENSVFYVKDMRYLKLTIRIYSKQLIPDNPIGYCPTFWMLNEESRHSWNSFREDVFFFSK